MLGYLLQEMDDAILASGDVRREQMMQLLLDPARNQHFQRVIFDILSGFKKA